MVIFELCLPQRQIYTRLINEIVPKVVKREMNVKNQIQPDNFVLMRDRHDVPMDFTDVIHNC